MTVSGLPSTTFGFTGLSIFPLPASFALTMWAATVAAGQRHLGVLERVLLVAIAVFSPFIGLIVVLVLAPRLVERSAAPR